MLDFACWVGGVICAFFLGTLAGGYITVEIVVDRLVHVLEERGYIDPAERAEAECADKAEVGAR